MSKNKITETVRPNISHANFNTIIAELQKAKEKLIKSGCPEESITGEIDTEYCCGDSWTVYNLTGERLETDKEYEARILASATYRAAQIANLEQQLARLKKDNASTT